MLDQRKIIAMVQVAMLEKEIGQEALDTAKYYREDYISNRYCGESFNIQESSSCFCLPIFLWK